MWAIEKVPKPVILHNSYLLDGQMKENAPVTHALTTHSRRCCLNQSGKFQELCGRAGEMCRKKPANKNSKTLSIQTLTYSPTNLAINKEAKFQTVML